MHAARAGANLQSSAKLLSTYIRSGVCQYVFLTTQLLHACHIWVRVYSLGTGRGRHISLCNGQHALNMKTKAPSAKTTRSSSKLTCIRKQKSKDTLAFDVKADLINRSCDQMGLLLSTIDSLEIRKSKATQVHTRSLLTSRIQILQAVYDTLYFYTAKKAHQIAKENHAATAA